MKSPEIPKDWNSAGDSSYPRVSFQDKQQFEGFLVGQQVISDSVPKISDVYGPAESVVRHRATDTKSSKPQFVTTFHSERADSYRQFVAKNQANTQESYLAPSEHSYRDENSSQHVGGSFVTKFHLPNNQNVRRDAAINQANFFALDKPIPEYVPGSLELANRPGFITQMPNTSSKWANTEFRTRIAKDQAGLFSCSDETLLRDGGNTVVLIKPTPKDVQLSGNRFELLSTGERSLHEPEYSVNDFESKYFKFLPNGKA